MQLLLFSDLHCDASAAQRLVEQSRHVDVVVGAGDFGTMRRGIETTIDILQSIDCPAILVPGNSESKEELAAACQSWPSSQILHGCGTVVADVAFFGLGGAVPVTPFGSWSYDFSEEQASELLADCPPACVLVSHSPPLGAADTDSSGKSLGSSSVRECIHRSQPRLVVCGHIHASAGRMEMIGTTAVINAGPRGVVHRL